MRPLIKHTIVIWTEPALQNAELVELAEQAIEGDAYCSKHVTGYTSDPETDPDWDGTEFFGVDEEDEETDGDA